MTYRRHYCTRTTHSHAIPFSIMHTYPSSTSKPSFSFASTVSFFTVQTHRVGRLSSGETNVHADMNRRQLGGECNATTWTFNHSSGVSGDALQLFCSWWAARL